MATEANAGTPTKSTACPNCLRLQLAADRRWVELQNLRARIMGFESVLSEYVWLVSETAATELDQDTWQERLDQTKERALDVLNMQLIDPDAPASPLEYGHEPHSRLTDPRAP